MRYENELVYVRMPMERMMAGMAWRPHGIRNEALPFMYEHPTREKQSSFVCVQAVCLTLNKVLDHTGKKNQPS